jgi:hypothetical protein
MLDGLGGRESWFDNNNLLILRDGWISDHNKWSIDFNGEWWNAHQTASQRPAVQFSQLQCESFARVRKERL